MDRDWTATFNDTFSAPASAVQARVWAQVLGDEHLPGLDAYSYLTASELRRIGEEVRVAPDDLLADLGCGRGGPGLWVAGERGCRLVGIDLAESAVAAAVERARGLGLEDRATFRVGVFEDLPLDEAELDAAMSVDALLFTPDKAAGLREIARVLRPGGRLVLTSWDFDRQPAGRPPQVEDHRPLLEAAGFTVDAYEETPRWRELQYGTTDGLLGSADELAAESGEDLAQLRADLEEMRASLDCMRRRVLVVATRQ
jgi:SAM-dependent methyltransferase